VAPHDQCVRLPGAPPGAEFTVSIMDRADLRLDPAVLGFTTGAPSGSGELRGWISFADAHAARAPQRSEERPERNQPTSAGGAPRGWQRPVGVAAENPVTETGHGTTSPA
jgi:hypothetical protein